MEKHISLLAEVAADWLTIHPIRKDFYLKLNKNMDLSIILDKLNSKIREEERIWETVMTLMWPFTGNQLPFSGPCYVSCQQTEGYIFFFLFIILKNYWQQTHLKLYRHNLVCVVRCTPSLSVWKLSDWSKCGSRPLLCSKLLGPHTTDRTLSRCSQYSHVQKVVSITVHCSNVICFTLMISFSMKVYHCCV